MIVDISVVDKGLISVYAIECVIDTALERPWEEIEMLDKKSLSRLLMSAAILTMGMSGAQAVETLRFSHTDNPGGSRQQAAELFAEKVAEYTDGRYEVQIFPSGSLANDPKAIELLQLGGIDFTVSATGSYATHMPTLNLTAMPFLVDTYEQGWELYDNSEWLQGEFAKLPEKGSGYCDVGSRVPQLHH